jgi:CubicO group peptidase (beta-lactamase class C family)
MHSKMDSITMKKGSQSTRLKQRPLLKKSGLSFILVTMILAITSCGESSKSVTTSAENANKFERLRSTLNAELFKNEAVAVSIAIYQNGEVVFAEAFGDKVQGGSEVATKDTLFQLGSTTKMFTALATAQLAEQNVVHLDESLLDALEGKINLSQTQQPEWQNITLRHLITHQSGLSDNYRCPASGLMNFAQTTYPAENPQMNPAGKFWNYSNSNYCYLGAIIEQKTQTPYADIMQQRVFQPLSMTRTTMSPTTLVKDGDFALGKGYIVVEGEKVPGFATELEQIEFDSLPSGGYTWSTPSEILKMADFLMHGNADVLSDELRLEMTSPHIELRSPRSNSYGYGIIIGEGFKDNDTWHPVKIWYHGGNTGAYTHKFWVLPESNVAVSIMSSGLYDNFTDSMVAALKSVTDLPTSENIPEVPVASDLFEQHVGVYQLGTDQTPFGLMEVRLEEGELMINIPEFNENATGYNTILKPLYGSTFSFEFDEQVLRITFIPDKENGPSKYIRHRIFVGVRIEGM